MCLIRMVKNAIDCFELLVDQSCNLHLRQRAYLLNQFAHDVLLTMLHIGLVKLDLGMLFLTDGVANL